MTQLAQIEPHARTAVGVSALLKALSNQDICGRKMTAMASNIGIANRNIITEPWTVKT